MDGTKNKMRSNTGIPNGLNINQIILNVINIFVYQNCILCTKPLKKGRTTYTHGN